MTFKVTIDVNERLVVCTISGELNDEEFVNATSLIRSQPDFDPSFSEIIDLSGVTAGTLSTPAIVQIARRESIFSRTSVHVIIAPEPHIFGLSRMAQVYAEKEKPNVVVVQTVEDARKVLGLKKTD
jgi:hypothetical protein